MYVRWWHLSHLSKWERWVLRHHGDNTYERGRGKSFNLVCFNHSTEGPSLSCVEHQSLIMKSNIGTLIGKCYSSKYTRATRKHVCKPAGTHSEKRAERAINAPLPSASARNSIGDEWYCRERGQQCVFKNQHYVKAVLHTERVTKCEWEFVGRKLQCFMKTRMRRNRSKPLAPFLFIMIFVKWLSAFSFSVSFFFSFYSSNFTIIKLKLLRFTIYKI